MAQSSQFYVSPHEFEPLLPDRRRKALAERGADVVSRAVRLTGAAHPTTIETLRGLLREMNSYYSNRIEGQSTHPIDIARALRSDYSGNDDIAALQRLARAHIEAEVELEGSSTASNRNGRAVASPVRHRPLLTRQLSADDRPGRTSRPVRAVPPDRRRPYHLADPPQRSTNRVSTGFSAVALPRPLPRSRRHPRIEDRGSGPHLGSGGEERAVMRSEPIEARTSRPNPSSPDRP